MMKLIEGLRPAALVGVMMWSTWPSKLSVPALEHRHQLTIHLSRLFSVFLHIQVMFFAN